MIMFKKAAVAIAAISMVAAPVVAFAAPAADLRALSSIEGENEAGSEIVLIVLAVAAAIGGIVAIADGSNDSPTSP